MASQRRREGYLQSDHRHAPGVPADLPRPRNGAQAVPAVAGQCFESATYTCHHCASLVVVGPTRTRALNYCPACDHYICDACEYARTKLQQACRPLAQLFEIAESLLRQGHQVIL